MTADELRELLTSAGVGRAADAVLAGLADSIRLHAAGTDEDELPLGASKIGGRPDLPPGFTWPDWRGVPQAFIAQVALADLAPYPAARALLPSGLLSFFYDAEQSAWGFDPQDRGCWLVAYTDAEPRDLRRTPRPGGDAFPACAVRFAAEVTLPTLETVASRFHLTPDERMAYLEIESLAYAQDGPQDLIHRLLGHPQPIQGDMPLECQLASHGLYVGDGSGYRDPRAAALTPGAADWRLLLQIDSDAAAEMMWGDAGRIYYWLPEAALARRDFSAAWLIYQCC